MVKDKLYVDIKGPREWFGMFSHCDFERTIIGFHNWIWKFQVINSEVVINYSEVNNYYGRREARPEELEEINKILKNLNYKINENTGKLIKTLSDKQNILTKLKCRKTLTEEDKEFLIKYLESSC
jgi:hypothetical protein